MDVYNNTRMFELKGHKPIEIPGGSISAENGKMLATVPMSSDFARMPEEGKAKSAVKKVYPNDPCPCGSGKSIKNVAAESNTARINKESIITKRTPAIMSRSAMYVVWT